MPSVKVYVDEGILTQKQAVAEGVLAGLRDFLCESLGVTAGACHIVLLSTRSLPHQTPVNVEMVLLRKEGRTRDMVATVCAGLRDRMAEWMGCQAAVRCTMMEAEHYIVAR